MTSSRKKQNGHKAAHPVAKEEPTLYEAPPEVAQPIQEPEPEPAPLAASVSLAAPVVGSADNRSVTIVATPTPANCLIYWAVSKATLPAGHKGGLGPSTLVFAPGAFDPGTYNVACHVVNPTDGTTGNATSTFAIPALPKHLVPAPPAP
jgi:hypothetical protein